MGKQAEIQKLITQAAATIAANAAAAPEKARLTRELFDGLVNRLSEEGEALAHVAAQNAVVEVIDEGSGQIYRRYVELGYDETDNGLRIMGEDISGNPVQIVFLSNTALERLHGLKGHGPDTPRH